MLKPGAVLSYFELMQRADFYRRVKVEGECWNWMGPKDKDGYGRLKRRARYTRAHREILLMEKEANPDGHLVLHRCDNPACVNPAHLFLGTQADNIRDKVAKGRQARGETHRSRTKPETILKGERHWKAKLSEHHVFVIRYLRKNTTLANDAIADMFGMHPATVSAIHYRRLWAHVP